MLSVSKSLRAEVPLSRLLVLFLCAAQSLISVAPAEAGCTNTTRTGAVSVPEFGPNNVRLWGALEPVAQGGPIPSTRDSTDEIDGFEFPNSAARTYRDVDQAGDFLFTTAPYGYELWQIATPAQQRDPLHVDTRDGYAGHFRTWRGVQGENNRVFVAGDAYLTSDGDMLFLEAGVHGLAVWEVSVANPSNPRLLFQEWASGGALRIYRDVEIAEINGTIYGFAIAGQFSGGVHVFNLSAARTLTTACDDDVTNGDTNCGVYAGAFNAPGSTLGWDVGVEGTTLVYTTASLQAHLYDLSTDVLNPTRLGQVGALSFNSEIWTDQTGRIAVATRDGSQVRVWDVTTCVTTGSCATVGVQRFSESIGNYLNERLMVSESGGRDFLYLLQNSGCPGRREREHLYDVSDLGSVQDLMPHATDTFVTGPDTTVASYSSYYNMGSLATGFSFVQPWGGIVADDYFYRAQGSIFDVHQVRVDPRIVVTGPDSAYLDQGQTFLATAESCDHTAGTWNWDAGAGSTIVGTGSSVSISWSSLGERTVIATNTACDGATLTGQAVSVLDPTPMIEDLRVNGEVIPSSIPWTGSDVCDALTFDAVVSGQPTLNYSWEIQDVVDGSAVVASGTGSTLNWDSAQLGTTVGGPYDLELMLTNSIDTATATRNLILNDLPVLAYGGVAPECGALNGACSTQDPAGSSTISLFANSVGANAWRWEQRPQSGGDYTMIADFGAGQAEQVTTLPTGDYEIRSTIRNCVDDTLQSTFLVTVLPPPLEPSFQIACPFGCIWNTPREILFVDSSQGPVETWAYDFLNPIPDPDGCRPGAAMATPALSFTYTQAGVYYPCLEVAGGGSEAVFLWEPGLQLIGSPDPGSISVSCDDRLVTGEPGFCQATTDQCTAQSGEWVWALQGGVELAPLGDGTVEATWPSDGVRTIYASNPGCPGTFGSASITILGPQLFADGFESGSAGAWSTTTP